MLSKFTFSLVLLAVASLTAFSQSTEQQFPTPVTINEINGAINPREIGDSRTTTYFYTFNGSQGDLFLNILSVNLNADIDLFIETGLRPLTKIVVYADRGETETGRVVYLRKHEKLLLRVQGRSPNDDPGKFRFKFAGSFVAAASDSPLPPELPKVPDTIIAEARPTPTEPKLADEEKKQTEPVDSAEKSEVQNPPEAESRKAEAVERSEAVADEPKAKPKVVVTDPVGEAAEKRSEETKERETRENRSRAETARETARRERDEARRKTETPDPMAAFRLVILFRDGSRIERPMTEVSRFSVDRGTLTVVNKGGTTGRYSMADVVSVTVQ